MKDVTAVIIDTVSIQKYIFNSNKLKENLGASHIVKNIFITDLKNTLCNCFPQYNGESFTRWEDCTYDKNDAILSKDEIVEIGYIGGGNALLFFSEKDNAIKFMKAFSRNILLKTPGVTLGMAYKDDVKAEDVKDNFNKFMEEMHEKLQKSKNSHFPTVKIPKFGITKDCPSSNEAADNCDRDKETRGKKVFISSVSKAKITAAKEAQDESETETKEEEGEKKQKQYKFEYTLTQQIDLLGQKEGENWVAVVHIDGNNMGIKFRDCNTLNKLRYLSKTVKEITEKTFNDLREKLETHLDTDEAAVKKILNIDNELPLRPIVIGGDDVTFVCNANLALYLTENFIKMWVRNMNAVETLTENNKDKNMEFSACGGIVFVKTKYPFYQSYSMAEDLCSRAKKLVKKHMNPEQKKEYSSLDFYIHQSSVSGHADDFIDDALHFGPYFVGDSAEGENNNNIENLMTGIKWFVNGDKNSEKWPRSKRKTLRDALNISETRAKKLMGELNARSLKLPYEGEAFHKTEEDKTDKKTPYMDMIEIMEFYPDLFRKWRDEK